MGCKAIELIRPGDVVLSRDELNPEGPVEPLVVSEAFVRVSPILRLKIGGCELRPTGEHPFYVPGRGWVMAGRLRPGDLVLTMSGEPARVDAVIDPGEVVTVYNFKVAAYHTYFVGADDWGFAVWAHNTNGHEAGARLQQPAVNNYRGRYQADLHQRGIERLQENWDVHHRIPQDYIGDPRFEGFDFHSPNNLQGVQGSRSASNIHQLVTNRWAEFMELNPNATRADIEAFANEIDILFADFWWR